jgi:cell shape-determining protein MreC
LLRARARDEAAVVAEILVRPPQVAFDSLVLGAGSREGVATGDAVLSQGVPVGVVVSADAARSVASLFSAPGSRLSVSVGGVAAESVGRGDGRYAVEMPAALAPATGTPVLSIAHRSAPIGYVTAVSPGEGEATVEAEVSLPVNLTVARYLTILPSLRGE